ncbi:stage II sporulation protein P [Peribacillus tepidiphilus]|uniref:stage II sporulation protein P n=1 Tax=Peribacillus tepidiphilus TaxID=2652445 RepID=UPI0035B501FA
MRRNQNVELITVIRGSTIIKGCFLILVMMLFVFSVSGLLTSLKPEYRISSQSVHEAARVFSGEMLFSLISQENHYFQEALPNKEPTPALSKQLLKLSANISLDDPRSLLGRELPGFSIFDSEILVAGEGTNYTNMPYESAPPPEVMHSEREAALQNLEAIDEPENKPIGSTNGKKVVYIYHTHNRESYLPYLKDVKNPDLAYHSKINVTKLGEKLTQELEEKGIGTLVDKTDVMGNLTKKGLTFPKAYQESRGVVQQAIASNNHLEYIIDIHRDSKRKEQTTITINGKNYAKLAFVVGGENAQFQKNVAIAEKLHYMLEKKFPGLSRGVLKQQGPRVNGKYNQDLSENAMLLEFGGVDNTFEELYRSVEAFSIVFSDYYWNEVNAKEVNSETKAEGK